MQRRSRPRLRPCTAALALCLEIVCAGLAAPAARAADPALEFEKYSLGNGLEVILHEDHRVPTVAVDVWYKVGSKDEVKGRTGFAHLFEHVMFQGTKHVPEDKHFDLLQRAGVSAVNGSTGNDRTNYFEVIPSNQLELALWLESERMGFLLERSEFQKTLDVQRDVVKNERRQRVENAPMGGVSEVQLGLLYPPDHPYSHEVIGSMADLSAASVADVKAFFRKWYAPNNATLVVAGDIDRAKTKELVERYFGPIPQGQKITRAPVPPMPTIAAERRVAMEAKIKLPQEFMTWHSARSFGDDEHALDVLASVLAGGKSSRLFKKLVYDLKVARSVSANQDGSILSGQFEIAFSPMPDHTLAEIEALVDQELERVRTQPVEPKELERVKNQVESSFVRGLESLLARVERLHTYNYNAGDPNYLAKDIAAYRAVDAAAVQRVAAKYLGKDARVVITVDPNDAAPIMGRVKK